MTHTYQIKGMHCSSCIAKVKSELLKLGDVLSAEVGLQPPQAVITMSKHIATGTLQVAVARAGDFIITEIYDQPVLNEQTVTVPDEKSSYFPVFLIFGYVALVSTLIQIVKGSFNWIQWMGHFMSGFFLVFSFFKMMNLRGFAEGYRTYDVVARNFPVWAFLYPFIELGLGIAFLTGFNPVATAIITLVIMGMSTVGVVQSLLKKQAIQCACLGTVIKLPLGKITLLEDLLMVVMSVIMLLIM